MCAENAFVNPFPQASRSPEWHSAIRTASDAFCTLHACREVKITDKIYLLMPKVKEKKSGMKRGKKSASAPTKKKKTTAPAKVLAKAKTPAKGKAKAKASSSKGVDDGNQSEASNSSAEF